MQCSPYISTEVCGKRVLYALSATLLCVVDRIDLSASSAPGEPRARMPSVSNQWARYLLNYLYAVSDDAYDDDEEVSVL